MKPLKQDFLERIESMLTEIPNTNLSASYLKRPSTDSNQEKYAVLIMNTDANGVKSLIVLDITFKNDVFAASIIPKQLNFSSDIDKCYPISKPEIQVHFLQLNSIDKGLKEIKEELEKDYWLKEIQNNYIDTISF